MNGSIVLMKLNVISLLHLILLFYRVPNKKIMDEVQMEKIKTFFEKHDNFKIRDIKNVEKLEVTLKTAEIFDLEKLYLFTLEGASVVFKSKILDKGSQSGVSFKI